MQVGFASLALQVSNIERGTCEAKVTRMGLFGDVRVQWKAGYPSGQASPGFRLGAITPSSGKTPIGGMIPEKMNHSSVDLHIILNNGVMTASLMLVMCYFPHIQDQ